jgi:DNA-binding transcriptional MocR family regulator
MTMWMPQLEGRPGPRYLAIADALGEDLEKGRVRPGSQLPTHRALADRLGVTVGTVSRAYAEAARRGLLSGEVGRGTFVRHALSAMPALPEARTPDVVDLSLNHPPPGMSELARALSETLAALSRSPDTSSLLTYPVEGGSAAHREAGAEWLARTGLAAQPENVVVCSGSQHALTTVLSTQMRPGDLLLTECLTYPGLKAVASLLHLRVQGLPMDDEGLRPDAFEAACRAGGAKALHCVPTIQNPTTALMSLARREEIAAIARTHGILVIEDDVHALLPPKRPRPIAALLPELTYYLTSTSKVLTPGLRVGYVLAPPGRAQALAAGIRVTTWGAVPLMVEVVSSWMRSGAADAIIEAIRREAAARQEVARRVLAGLEVQAHPYGMHVWLLLPEPWRSDGFAAVAGRRGVLVSPAEAFLVGRTAGPHAVRISLGSVLTRGELEKGLSAIREVVAGAPDSGLPIV